MATVDKKRKPVGRLPKLEDAPQPSRKRADPRARGDAKTKGKDENDKMPDIDGKKKQLPPLRGRVKAGGRDSRSMMEMRKKSPVETGLRPSLTATTDAKTVKFFKDGDYKFDPIHMVISLKKYRKIDSVKDDLSKQMRGLTYGVRSIFTPHGRHRIYNLEEFTDGGEYVCSTNNRAKGLDTKLVRGNGVWHNKRPESGRRVLSKLLQEIDRHSAKVGPKRQGHDLSKVYMRTKPRTVTMMKNGEPDKKHPFVLNRRTAQSFDRVMEDLSDIFGFAVTKLYTLEGHPVKSLQTLLTGPNVIICAGPGGNDSFIPRVTDYTVSPRLRSNMGSQATMHSVHSRLASRRERATRTKGRWTVIVRTNELPSAGTQAQVTINVYGSKGHCRPITLGHGDGKDFQPGQINEFDIEVGAIGEVYKIRLAHDNSGDFPGWLCDEVTMIDKDTKEELIFGCRRWLARDEDDQDITRELTAKRQREPILPVVKYQVDVYTGDVWGGGTDANVYITIYGDRGDTGARQLYTETKGVYFKQGQMDSFEVEAVSLSHLRRIIIGHDGTDPGAGWFLDKVVIREIPVRATQGYVFHFGQWLDEGEDDGKIVKETRVQDEYMDDILEKRNWEFEHWKFGKNNNVMFYSMVTGKALRMKDNLTVDGIGEEKDKSAIYTVKGKKSMKPMFSSVVNPNNCLAIESSRVTGMGKGGPACEFRVRVQQDRSVLLENVKNALQFITITPDGSPGEVRGILDKDPNRRFFVYCKGMFRHRGIIMLGTSNIQSICVDRLDGSLTGRGKRTGPASQFRVHKVSSGGIRMFESMAMPGSYLRIKDGKIDCQGLRDTNAHFLVIRHKDKGYITLQAANQRGLFLGMTPDGKVHTTIDTGVRNIWLYPEVVEFGVPKDNSQDVLEQQTMQMLQEELSQASIPDFVPETSRNNKQYAEGDWSIQVSTVDQMYGGDVALVAYGDKGNSGQIILGGPPGKEIFQDANEDEFRANLLKIGKLFKIRLELLPKSSTKDASWKVKDVKMQDLSNKELLKFDFNRWLSKTQDDLELMRELPVIRPGEPCLPVHQYKVSVYTGKEIGAETDAQIYINLYGENGDWGKRMLIKSTNTKKHRIGQVDTFTVEGVSLGKLHRCVIGHDGTGAGEGWYLEQVVIKDGDNAREEYIFPCNRWLDTGMEDRKIERTLMVKEPSPSKVAFPAVIEEREEDLDRETPMPVSATPDQSEPVIEQAQQLEDVQKDTTEEPKSGGEFKLWVITSKESKQANGGRVSVVVYGDKGKSEDIKLYAPNPNQKTFEPGSIDEFEVSVGDIGPLYKLRVVREESDKWDGWYLDEVKMEDKDTHEMYLFSFDRWLSRGMDDGDLVRELPAVIAGKPAAQLYQYVVQVYTGDHWAAGTDANMYITIQGSKGDSGRRLLHKSSNNRVKFQRGQMDTFEFDVVDMGQLQTVDIKHDGRGHGAGIFLDKVVVKEKGTDKSHLQSIFPCGRWLDDHEDDCCPARTLRMIDTIDALNIPQRKDGSKKSNGQWSVIVQTSELTKAVTSAKVYLSVYGSGGQSDKLRLKADEMFVPGTETEFLVTTGEVGKVNKIRLQHDASGMNPDLHVDYVKMTDMETQEELVFYLNRWLSTEQDDGQICREIPLIKKGVSSLPVLRYVIAMRTGNLTDAGAEQSSVSINLVGVNGDTGLRELGGPLTKNRFLWQAGNEDIFVLESVSVGKLKRIEVQFNARGQDKSWYLQQASVAEGARAISQSITFCHSWFNTAEPAEFPVSEVQPTTSLIETLESIPQGMERPVRSKGRWMVWVQTGLQNDAGTTEKVCLALCGLKSESEPVHVNANDDLNPGSFIKFEAKVPDIGLLIKVRVYFEDKHQGTSWFLAKLKLKDLDTSEELHFDHGDWIESTDNNPEGAVELPVIRPDIAPLKEQIYIVCVTTGDLLRAETDADVFCNLIGQWGSTNARSLVNTETKQLFKRAQMGQFTITCMELGYIRKLTIGHNQSGRGQGWYCQSVTVKVAEQTETVFPCYRWLDTGCDDRQLTQTLLPIGRLPLTWSPPTKYMSGGSDGKWNIHITTAGVEMLPNVVHKGKKTGEVSIVVYGSNSVQGPIALGRDDEDHFLFGKTDRFDDQGLGDIGVIEKIRVSSGYEGDIDAVWTIQEVILEDQLSKDMLKFDFSAWVGEMGGDIRKELPVILPGTQHSQLVKYYIEVYTSEAEMNASTNSHVFITLYGDNSDSGRRHLIKNRDAKKRFQTGEQDDLVDKFALESVDLGDLSKVVVAKGPGKPWLLEKVVIKVGEFASKEHVFIIESWIGSKETQQQEIEETIKLTATVPGSVAVPLSLVPDLPTSDGVWKIETLTGGRRGPEGHPDIVVVFCGVKGESKPLPLMSDRENPLQIGQVDRFSVKFAEDVGEITKVRLGFTDHTDAKAWYIRTITCTDVKTGDTFMNEPNDWLSVDNKLDGWKEIPALWPAIDVYPVLRYVVTVHIGEVGEHGAGSDLYVHVFGEYGTSGRRYLKHSLANQNKIAENQVDVFEVEAVQLGDLEKIIIGHESLDAGHGWYLERVVIQESPDSKENLFECNRWLDAGEADGKIERVLFPIQMADQTTGDQNNSSIIVPLLSPKPPSPEDERPTEMTPRDEEGPEEETPKEDEPQVEEALAQEAVPRTPTPDGFPWTVETLTGNVEGEGEGTGSAVQMVLYGSKGKSQPFVVGDANGFRFNSGQQDSFKVYVKEDIGQLYKVRLGFHGEQDDLTWFQTPESAPSWYLHELKLKDEANQSEYLFEADLWVKIDGDHDHWRELAVSNVPDVLPAYLYQVEVFTGEKSKAGTDANVFLQIFGETGDTGYRKLMTSKTNDDKFEQGQRDVFEIAAVDLGKLTKINLRHDGSGGGSGWFLDRVVIRESPTTTIRYVFRCEGWLDVQDGERFVEQELLLTDMLVADEDEEKDLPGKPWRVETLTGEDNSVETNIAMEMILYGDIGCSNPIVVGEKADFRFIPGQADTFHVRVLDDVGEVYKVRVGFHNVQDDSPWYKTTGEDSILPVWAIQKLTLVDEMEDKQYEFSAEVSVKFTQYQDYWRELPVNNTERILPVYDYQVQVLTGDESKGGTDANVYLQIYGERGDTGRRKLMASKTYADKFEQGNEDVFEISAVDLGSLQKVKVSHDGSGMGSGWFLSRIIIKDSEDAKTRYVFKCEGWLDVEEEGRIVEQEFPLSEILVGDDPDIEEERVEGDPWTVWTVTGDEVSAGTNSAVELIIYGDKGHSQPLIIGAADDFGFNPAQVDRFELHLQEEVGQVYKVRVGFHDIDPDIPWYNNVSSAPSWFIKSLKLKDETTGSEYETKAGVWVCVDDYQDFWKELPVTRGESTLEVLQYQVDVYTGEQFRAGTDANVFIQLYGERGDTGSRRLMSSKTNTNKFEGGEKDTFELSAVDLGQLTKVKVSHDGSGSGSGWLLDKIVIREFETSTSQYVFNCGRWLDEGSGGSNVEVILPLSEVKAVTPEPEVPPSTGEDGQYTVAVTTSTDDDSGTDSCVYLTVYGDAENTGPIPLGEPSTGYFYSGKTDQFDITIDVENIGQLRKIRLEHDDSGETKGWKVDKIVLRKNSDNTEMEFPINKWLTSADKSCDIAVEVPIQGHNWPVRDYVVQTLTGDGFNAGTESRVYINLIGTLGDSGKRYLIHNHEDPDKFGSGQIDSFTVQAVDLGRMNQVLVGHTGSGNGTGWFIKHVSVMESREADNRYIFTCNQWLDDTKGDNQIERLLELDRIEPVTDDTKQDDTLADDTQIADAGQTGDDVRPTTSTPIDQQRTSKTDLDENLASPKPDEETQEVNKQTDEEGKEEDNNDTDNKQDGEPKDEGQGQADNLDQVQADDKDQGPGDDKEQGQVETKDDTDRTQGRVSRQKTGDSTYRVNMEAAKGDKSDQGE